MSFLHTFWDAVPVPNWDTDFVNSKFEAEGGWSRIVDLAAEASWASGQSIRREPLRETYRIVRVPEQEKPVNTSLPAPFWKIEELAADEGPMTATVALCEVNSWGMKESDLEATTQRTASLLPEKLKRSKRAKPKRAGRAKAWTPEKQKRLYTLYLQARRDQGYPKKLQDGTWAEIAAQIPNDHSPKACKMKCRRVRVAKSMLAK